MFTPFRPIFTFIDTIPAEFTFAAILGVAFLFLIIGIRVNSIMMQLRLGTQIAGLLGAALNGGSQAKVKPKKGNGGIPVITYLFLGIALVTIYNYANREQESHGIAQKQYEEANHPNADRLLYEREYRLEDQKEIEVPEDVESYLKEENQYYSNVVHEYSISAPDRASTSLKKIKEDSPKITVQIAAVSMPENAREAAQKLKDLFPSQAVLLYQDDESGLIKILIGPFRSRLSVKDFQKRLRKAGYGKSFVFDLSQVSEYDLSQYY